MRQSLYFYTALTKHRASKDKNMHEKEEKPVYLCTIESHSFSWPSLPSSSQDRLNKAERKRGHRSSPNDPAAVNKYIHK